MPRALGVCESHSNWAQQAAIPMYSISVGDKAIKFCFLGSHKITDCP